MKLSATLSSGQTVTIVNIEVNGCMVYTSYVDNSNKLFVTGSSVYNTSAIATNCTVVS